MTDRKHLTHAEHAKRAGVGTPCTAHHINYGGGCLHCGWTPPVTASPPTPLTDAELALIGTRAARHLYREPDGVAGGEVANNAEFAAAIDHITRTLGESRASEARLLAALKEAERNLSARIESRIYSVSDKPVREQVRAAIAAAEGRAAE